MCLSVCLLYCMLNFFPLSFQFEPTPLDEKKPRKSRLNVAPVTVRPKSLRHEPTFVVVKQQYSSDITYGRVESAPSYKVHHAITSEKPRDDIVIEETTLEDRSRRFPKQQPTAEETYREDRKEKAPDFFEKSDLDKSTNKVGVLCTYASLFPLVL